jgi:hypothetical protein
MDRRTDDQISYTSRLTRAHIMDAFPTMAALAQDVSAAAFLRLLTAELGAFGDNLHYAQTIAAALISHVDDQLFSELPRHWIAYRAAIDEFCSQMKPGTERTHIRAIAKSMERKRCAPAAFRSSVQAWARKYRLHVPDGLRECWHHNEFSIQIKFRCPLSIVTAIKARAIATGTCSAEWIRQAIYERIYRDDH